MREGAPSLLQSYRSSFPARRHRHRAGTLTAAHLAMAQGRATEQLQMLHTHSSSPAEQGFLCSLGCEELSHGSDGTGTSGSLP